MDILARDELLQKASGPKVVPTVAKKVLDMVRRDNSSIAQLCGIVEKDQTLTAGVLKIANSAFYGLPQEVTSLKQAIIVLGFNAIRDLIITISTKSQYKRFGITEQLLWDHSIGAAIACRLFARGQGAEVEEVAFLCGMMHDFGKVIMNNECPLGFVEAMQTIYNEGTDSLSAEQEVFGYTHTEIGSMIVEKWEFPPVLSRTMACHHLHTCSLVDFEDRTIAKAVACSHLADNACKVLGIGFRSPDESIILDDLPSAAFLGFAGEGLDALVRQVNKTYAAEKTVFQ